MAKTTKKTTKKTKSKSDKKKSLSSRVQARWPQERQVIYRPDRWEYIKGQHEGRVIGSRGGCVFCESLERGLSSESLVAYVGSKAMIVLNKYPYNLGHLMVLPKRHEGDLMKLSKDEYSEITRLIRVSVAALKQVFDAKEFNVGINLGRSAGAGIPEHLHIHVLPRFAGDTNFFPLIAETKALPGDLQSVYEEVAPAIKMWVESQDV